MSGKCGVITAAMLSMEHKTNIKELSFKRRKFAILTKKIKKILGVRRRRIPLLISVGYPDAPTREKVRKPLDVMSSWNQY